MKLILILVVIALVVRIGLFIRKKSQAGKPAKEISSLGPLKPWQRKLYTIWVFFVVNMKRLFRDRTALFFTFLFPLIFLFVFGGIFGKTSGTSFNVAIINDSHSQFAQQFTKQINSEKIFKVNHGITDFKQANEQMSRGQLDATIELPANFGVVKDSTPTGQAVVHYTENSSSAAQTLTSVLQAQFEGINDKLVKTPTPFTVTSQQTNTRSLSQFDYTFTGLLGFAILGAGIFGPINVFPELKKMGILRRLHTTPLRVWQYFLSTMLGNAVVGLMSLGLMFIVAIAIFNLKVVGNYFELALFLAFGIIMVLGIGLAVGGWAKNERQAAPLANIIVFPMMFLTGVFFPRFLMPEWLQHITTFMPLTPVIDGARLIATEGQSLFSLGPQLAVMAGWTVIVYAVAFRVFRWE
jgi:ABC-2 type transport system permease protein